MPSRLARVAQFPSKRLRFDLGQLLLRAVPVIILFLTVILLTVPLSILYQKIKEKASIITIVFNLNCDYYKLYIINMLL